MAAGVWIQAILGQRRTSKPLEDHQQIQPKWALTTLKERLLRTMLPVGMDEEQTRFLRLAAGEAEALAWLTPFPHLFLPVLLEEKLCAAKQYVTRQGNARIPRPQFSRVAG